MITTDQLMEMPVYGNCLADQDVWTACLVVARDESRPMADRLKALEKTNQLTGEDDPCDEEALADYLEMNEGIEV